MKKYKAFKLYTKKNNNIAKFVSKWDPNKEESIQNTKYVVQYINVNCYFTLCKNCLIIELIVSDLTTSGIKECCVQNTKKKFQEHIFIQVNKLILLVTTMLLAFLIFSYI